MNIQLAQKSNLTPMLGGTRIKCAEDRRSQNALALEGIEKIKVCAEYLAERGYTVLRAETGRRRPRVEIQDVPRCALLEGSVHTVERNSLGVWRGWVAILYECEVRWTAGGAA